MQSTPDNFGGPKGTPDNFGGPKTTPDNFGGPKISNYKVQFSTPADLGPASEKITNVSNKRLTWKAEITYTSETPDWLHLSKLTGLIDAHGDESIEISANTTGLTAGQTYYATVDFNWDPPQGSSSQIVVSVTVA